MNPSLSAPRTLFAAAVKGRRRELGLTQAELAERAEMHRTYITDIERGARNLSLESMDKLARALQLPIKELFAGRSNGHAGGSPCPSVDILLVEDNLDDQALVLMGFRAARVKNRIHTVQDGVEAMDFLFRQGAYASHWTPHQGLVVLLDLGLPRLNGLEVLRRIRGDARTKNLPVVVLTASDHSPDMAECLRLGCSHYIVKPVGFENFSRITPLLSLDWELVGGRNGGGAVSAGLAAVDAPPGANGVHGRNVPGTAYAA